MLRTLRSLAVAVALLLVAAGSAPAQSGGRLPTSEADLRRIIDADFPRLNGNFRILKPASPTYNCIAWSLGITTKWVWEGDTVADFDELNARFGFRRVKGLDFSPAAGYEKIVLYAKRQDGRWVATHQARQLRSGVWTSKLGKLPLISHDSPADLNGSSYGQPIAVYVRKTK